MFWFNVFYDNVNNFINILNIIFDQLKIVFLDVFVNKNCKKYWFEWSLLYGIDLKSLLQHI
jgi:hypothetical protein